MKLDKMQVNALASKLCTEINAVYGEGNKESKEASDKAKEEFYEAKMQTELYQSVGDILEKMKNASGYYGQSLVKTFLQTAFEEEWKTLPKHEIKSVSLDEIRNDIVISTIDADNLDELIETIKAKYV
jgi:hypothetical protein